MYRPINLRVKHSVQIGTDERPDAEVLTPSLQSKHSIWVPPMGRLIFVPFSPDGAGQSCCSISPARDRRTLMVDCVNQYGAPVHQIDYNWA